MTIATDIICGFPGETEQDHAQTIAFLDHYKLPVVNISQFYPRPGTLAARMTRVPTHVVKERSREVSALFASYATHDHMVGAEVQVLVTDLASDGKHYVGHTKGYVQVLLHASSALMGSTVLVRITEAAKFYLRGEVLRCVHPAPRLSRPAGQVVVQHRGKKYLASNMQPVVADVLPSDESIMSSESCSKPGSSDCGCGKSECSGGSCGEDGCKDGSILDGAVGSMDGDTDHGTSHVRAPAAETVEIKHTNKGPDMGYAAADASSDEGKIAFSSSACVVTIPGRVGRALQSITRLSFSLRSLLPFPPWFSRESCFLVVSIALVCASWKPRLY